MELNDIEELFSQDITYVQNGVLFVKGEPFYVIKRFSQGDLDLVACFDPDVDSLLKWKDSHNLSDIKPDSTKITIKPEQRNPYNKKASPASKLAYEKFNQTHDPITKIMIKKPLFISLVTIDEDTLRGDQVGVKGFYEYTKPRQVIDNVKQTVATTRDATGIFFALDRVEWVDMSIPTAGLERTLNQSAKDFVSHLMLTNINLGD